MISLEFPWWYIPLGIFAIGFLYGFICLLKI